jgi:hypothetical protein
MFIEHAKTAGDWQAKHPTTSAGIRCELGLVQDVLEQRLESQGRTMLLLDQALHQRLKNAMRYAEKLAAMEAERSGLKSLLGETAASRQKAARDTER